MLTRFRGSSADAHPCPSKCPDLKDYALFSVIPANDTKTWNFFSPRVGIKAGPLAPEASALTNELPRFYLQQFLFALSSVCVLWFDSRSDCSFRFII